eukprot:6202564-Pleurochrysis_carterae.AAC.1
MSRLRPKTSMLIFLASSELHSESIIMPVLRLALRQSFQRPLRDTALALQIRRAGRIRRVLWQVSALRESDIDRGAHLGLRVGIEQGRQRQRRRASGRAGTLVGALL